MSAPSRFIKTLAVLCILVLAFTFFTTNVARVPRVNIISLWDEATELERRLKWSLADIQNQANTYRNNVNIFGNKEDFAAWKNILASNENKLIVVAGVNKGQSIRELLSVCPAATIHGFEITKTNVADATNAFKDNNNVMIHHAGMGESIGKSSVATSADESSENSGLFTATGRFSSFKQTTYEVEVTTFVTFHDSLHIGSRPFDYVLIDTEGHEPNVIFGMHLEIQSNRQRFPMFQYELGGTWADDRHDSSMPNQFGVAYFLESVGYQLYLMGSEGLLRVGAEFFRVGAVNRELKYEAFVQGNLLAVAPNFISDDVREKIKKFQRPEN